MTSWKITFIPAENIIWIFAALLKHMRCVMQKPGLGQFFDILGFYHQARVQRVTVTPVLKFFKSDPYLQSYGNFPKHTVDTRKWAEKLIRVKISSQILLGY